MRQARETRVIQEAEADNRRAVLLAVEEAEREVKAVQVGKRNGSHVSG